MNKKTLKFIVESIATLTLIFSVFSFAYAQNRLQNYTVLSPLPGTTDNCVDGTNRPITYDAQGNQTGGGCQTTLQTYLPGMFKLAIGVAAVLAFIMLTWAGILYMTTDAISGKGKARSYIENALWGLLLVIGAWVILYTINPKLLSFNLILPQLNTQTGQNIVTVISGQDLASDTTIRQSLLSHGVTTNFPACQGTATTNCTNVVGLTDTTINTLDAMSQRLGCDGPGNQTCITITGGTEGGHTPGSTHLNGTGVDLQATSALNDLIISNASSCQPGSGSTCAGVPACSIYTYNGNRYLWEPLGSTCGGEVPSSNNHWHATITK